MSGISDTLKTEKGMINLLLLILKGIAFLYAFYLAHSASKQFEQGKKSESLKVALFAIIGTIIVAAA